ncbi:uncharacterized protein BCR38DRAFT_501385 [Pseudomassariella vexata]|uniref:Uncharacterized protein n=1 Tax=Pseudomassariella vexata TaxID=1141098 RepID=A0A1Y2DEU2_9PEZI|nr:uncharacterized protein BCR38DRAFT_501385 [Pseudomassariella vexata]ORY57800.1 hypothetical protein BCR38DRAFT_501385 [Pseudomassariella vexata]
MGCGRYQRQHLHPSHRRSDQQRRRDGRPQAHKDKEAIEMMFLANHLGHFLLINLLMSKIFAAGPVGRIVNLSRSAIASAPAGSMTTTSPTASCTMAGAHTGSPRQPTSCYQFYWRRNWLARGFARNRCILGVYGRPI